ncbi:MAG: hypothetical protein FJ405_04620 [Verrucomicrobia bacterium]|nr:hypothetical protein [Verrucomicrobiota bacterium]
MILSSIVLGSAQENPPSVDPYFRANITIWVAAESATEVENGTETAPYVIGRNGMTFDRFMSQFRFVPNVTFLLKEGIYRTRGTYEVNPNGARPQYWWEPSDGWRILGAGTNRTFLLLENPEETRPTKHYAIGNPFSGKFPSHVEIAHMTIDAQGELNAQTRDSNFGCLYLLGSYLYIHDIECVGAFSALSPQASNAGVFRELFILGTGGPDRLQVTNNIISRCVVKLSPRSPRMFPGAPAGVTTAIVNAANTAGTDSVQDLCHSPVIEFCEVVSPDVLPPVHGISIFGARNGLAISNIVRNVRFPFYSDDSPYTESVWVVGNVFTNCLIGAYLNYNQSTNTWGRAAFINNRIYLNEAFASATPSNSTSGISLFGAMTNLNHPNLTNMVIAGNTIAFPATAPASSIRDTGISIVGCKNTLVVSNTILLTHANTSFRVLPIPGRGESFAFCANLDGAGNPIFPIDRSLPGCQTGSTTGGGTCFMSNSDCVDPSSPFSGPFAFASALPPRERYRSQPLPGLHFAWEAEEGDLISPAKIVASSTASGGSSVTSSTENAGGVRFDFYLPLPRVFSNMICWARIHPSESLFSGFADVEFNGERMLFGEDNDIQVAEYVHYALAERVPGANTNRIRRFTLGPGWYSMTFWFRNPGVRLDQIVVSTASETLFRPSGPLVARLRAEGRAGTQIANQCPWVWSEQAENAELEYPAEILDAPGAMHGSFVRSQTADRGGISFRFWIPQSGIHKISLRMRPSLQTGYRTSTLLVDGRAWIALGANGDGWDWTSRIDSTEALANRNAPNLGHFRLSEGWHTIVWRTRHPGVDFDAIRIEAIETDQAISVN